MPVSGNFNLAPWLDYHFGQATARQRLNTWRSLVAGRFNLPRHCPSPWMLQVEVTNRCNLKCTFCSRYSTAMKLGDMAPDLMEAVVELSAGVQEVALFGYGEPLLSKAFYSLLPRLRSARVGFFTNGMLLDERLLRKILRLSARPLSYIVFSVDGATRQTYETIRQGGDFRLVWRNLENAVRFREREPDWGRPALRLEFVAMRRNIEEMAQMVRRADEAGIDELKVSHLVVWNESLRKESLLYYPELCRRSFEKAIEEAAHRRIKLNLPKVLDASPGSETRVYPPCRFPWHFAMISFEGEVRACCFAPDLLMGDLKKHSFQNIWQSDRYLRLRRSLNTPDCPASCRRCEERFRQVTSPNEEMTYIKLTPRQK